jgi:hypothetical protein
LGRKLFRGQFWPSCSVAMSKGTTLMFPFGSCQTATPFSKSAAVTLVSGKRLRGLVQQHRRQNAPNRQAGGQSGFDLRPEFRCKPGGFRRLESRCAAGMAKGAGTAANASAIIDFPAVVTVMCIVLSRRSHLLCRSSCRRTITRQPDIFQSPHGQNERSI